MSEWERETCALLQHLTVEQQQGALMLLRLMAGMSGSTDEAAAASMGVISAAGGKDVEACGEDH